MRPSRRCASSTPCARRRSSTCFEIAMSEFRTPATALASGRSGGPHRVAPRASSSAWYSGRRARCSATSIAQAVHGVYPHPRLPWAAMTLRSSFVAPRAAGTRDGTERLLHPSIPHGLRGDRFAESSTRTRGCEIRAVRNMAVSLVRSAVLQNRTLEVRGSIPLGSTKTEGPRIAARPFGVSDAARERLGNGCETVGPRHLPNPGALPATSPASAPCPDPGGAADEPYGAEDAAALHGEVCGGVSVSQVSRSTRRLARSPVVQRSRSASK